MPEPTVVNGMTQKPLEGASLLHTFNDAKAKSRHTTQYFRYRRQPRHLPRRLVHHHAAQGVLGKPRATFENDTWELYNANEASA